MSNMGHGGVINNPTDFVPINTSKECKFQAKNWVMTINNYRDNILEELKDYLVPLCIKYVFYKEIGKEGTKHIQGAFILKKKTRQGTIYNLLKCKFFLEKMKGKWNDQIYCLKEGGEGITNIKFIQIAKMTYDKLRDNQKQIVDIPM